MAGSPRDRRPRRGRSRRPRKLPTDRQYGASREALVRDTIPRPLSIDEQHLALATYVEINAAWRTLTDVRFKLLALLPPVAALGLLALVSPGGPLAEVQKEVRLAGAIFGFLVTAGLWIYDARNSELYDDLISRGRRAEFELGIHAGVFMGRKKPQLYGFLGREFRPISHGVALIVVYSTVLMSWLVAFVLLSLGWLP